jgi:hypothetical protein
MLVEDVGHQRVGWRAVPAARLRMSARHVILP